MSIDFVKLAQALRLAADALAPGEETFTAPAERSNVVEGRFETPASATPAPAMPDPAQKLPTMPPSGPANLWATAAVQAAEHPATSVAPAAVQAQDTQALLARVRDLGRAIYERDHDPSVVPELFARFGASRTTDLKPEHLPEVIRKLEEYYAEGVSK